MTEEKKLDRACEDVAGLKEFQRNTESCIRLMQTDIEAIKTKLLGRPSWAVLVIISGLTTLCAGLSVFIITR